MRASVANVARRERGAALVVTLIVCTVLAMVVVALMQNTGLDRASSRSIANQYRAQLAAESGLAEAMALIQSNAAGFTYVSGGEPLLAGGYRTYIRPRSVAGGVWQFSGDRVYLDSGTGGESADLLVAGTNAVDGVVVRAAYKTVSVTNNATNRYAFWVDDGSGKQNLSWWGASGTDRGLLANITNAALVLPSANGTTVAPMPGSALAALSGVRNYTDSATNLFGQLTPFRSVSNGLLTPATFNLLDTAIQGRANRYFFTLSSPSSAVSPAGRRKLNLAQLARYLNGGISSAQGATSPRALLVEDLLKANPTNQINWGGGDLNWLATVGKYSATEQRQIVANLLDYLDEDLVPTTDSATAPTYLGVESKATLGGSVRGHPFINFMCTGLVFNRSQAAATLGQINSTRVLATLGVVYPWAAAASSEDYSVEIQITMQGTVNNGSLGANAEVYFRKPLSDQASAQPSPTLQPFSGSSFPAPVNSISNYATPFYTLPTKGPTNIEFVDLVYRADRARLLYTPTGVGAPVTVQALPANLTITQSPTSISPGGAPGPYPVKFTQAQFAQTPNLYLSGDPRLGFQAAKWVWSASTGGLSQDIPPPADQAVIDMTNGISEEWDEAQNLPMNFAWFTSASCTNHFNRSPTTAIDSIGEIGYLWTGKPWQTLNLTRTNNTNTADHNLLDYLAGGFTNGGAAYATMPLLAPSATGPGVTESNSLLQDGGFNVLTRKLATVTAYLTNAPGISASAAAELTALPPPELPSLGGALAALTNLSSVTTTKFGREGIVRAMANGAVTQSRIFTVYSRGEYVSPGARSQALLEADIFVDVDPESGTPVVRVVSKKFL